MKCMKNQNEEKKTGDDSVVLPLIQDNATSTERASTTWSTPATDMSESPLLRKGSFDQLIILLLPCHSCTLPPFTQQWRSTVPSVMLSPCHHRATLMPPCRRHYYYSPVTIGTPALLLSTINAIDNQHPQRLDVTRPSNFLVDQLWKATKPTFRKNRIIKSASNLVPVVDHKRAKCSVVAAVCFIWGSVFLS